MTHELDQYHDYLDQCYDEEGYELETDPQYEDGDLAHDLYQEEQCLTN